MLISQWVISDHNLSEIEKILAQEPINWEYFNALLAQHEFSSFAYSCLKNYPSLIPGSEVDLLKKNHYFSLWQLAGLENEFLDILNVFKSQGLDLLPIKGVAFLMDNLYGDKAGLRPMVDIDILVKKEKLSQSEKLVETLGYQKELCGLKEDYWRKKSYHIAFVKNKCRNRRFTLEIHWLLDYPRKIYLLPSLWERTRKISAGNREVTLLSAEDTLFCLTLHLRRYGNVLSLKSACDFACLLAKYKNLDWDYILKEAKKGQMCTSLYFRLVQACIFFNIQIPNLVWQALSPGNCKKRLIEGFILKNTFLKIDQDRSDSFLMNHFLVYDNFWEPIIMIIKIPLEQFSKFYRLPPYSCQALLLYRLRFLYLPYYLFELISRAILRILIKREK